MEIRQFRHGDGRAAARLFRENIFHVNRKDYDEAALRAWAAGADDEAAWEASFTGRPAFAAWDGGELAGFGDLRGPDYVDRLFARHDRQGEGIGTALLAALEAASSAARLRADVSLTARPFFLARGWRVVRRQEVTRRGVVLVNFVMEKERGGQ